MKNFLRSSAIWISAFAGTYAVMVLLNTAAASFHSGQLSYMSSRTQQEISSLAEISIHLIPALAVGFWGRQYTWQIAGIGSLLIEVVGAVSMMGTDGFAYVGQPLTNSAASVLLALLAAYWAKSRTANEKIRI